MPEDDFFVASEIHQITFFRHFSLFLLPYVRLESSMIMMMWWVVVIYGYQRRSWWGRGRSWRSSNANSTRRRWWHWTSSSVAVSNAVVATISQNPFQLLNLVILFSKLFFSLPQPFFVFFLLPLQLNDIALILCKFFLVGSDLYHGVLTFLDILFGFLNELLYKIYE